MPSKYPELWFVLFFVLFALNLVVMLLGGSLTLGIAALSIGLLGMGLSLRRAIKVK